MKPSRAHFFLRFSQAVLLFAGMATANYYLWLFINRSFHIPNWNGQIKGLAYSGFRQNQSPLEHLFPSPDQLAEDVALLATKTKQLRSYSISDGTVLADLAASNGLSLTAGAWLDRRLENNRTELDTLLALADTHPAIPRVIVGNEAILRSDLSAEELIAYLDEARATLQKPVSTAEPWHVWLKYPQLADHVDFLTVHLLPYWEGLPRRQAVSDLLNRYKQLQNRFPGKAIVIGEVGWPSNGDRLRFARASLADQAAFLREFLNHAEKLHLDYFLMEAFDQPWKMEGEGRVGAYWGLFDAKRNLKFPLTGPVEEDAHWRAKAWLSILLACPWILWFAYHYSRFHLAGRFLYSLFLQASFSLVVWLIGIPFDFYLSPLDWTVLALLLPAQLAMLAILLINGFEFVEVIWNRKWLRHFHSLSLPSDRILPKVSLHLACCNEPPEMVILTLNSLAALDYSNLEVIVVDNNTSEESVWRPVEQHCALLGDRFRFFHLNPWPGFKAGALNFALEKTAHDSEIIGVIDSDYEVDPQWLQRFIPHFLESEKVGVVQAPQAHREWQQNWFRRICNWEYDGFFRIGMHHRHERNAIIQHGTMTLVRRQPLQELGAWAEWCICEDAELGLRLLQHGWEMRYIDEIVGRGLTPADFTAYKSQRFRWAFGAMQILKRHWAWLTKKGPLDLGQRFHFLTGWFSWFSDALHLVFTLLTIGWTIGMVYQPQIFNMPLSLFLIPLLFFSLARALFGIFLYRSRVPCGWVDTALSSIASMALSHSIARGIFKGLFVRRGEFVRTAKRRRLRKRPSHWLVMREEALLFFALALATLAMAAHWPFSVLEVKLWIAILLAQSLPYLSAVITGWIAVLSEEKPALLQQSPAPSQLPTC